MENKVSKVNKQQDFELTCEVLGIEPAFYPIYLDLLCDEVLLTRSELRKKDIGDIVVDMSFIHEFKSELHEINENSSILASRLERMVPIQNKVNKSYIPI